MPNELPIIQIGNKKYYIDKRLNQIRNIKNPNDYETESASLIEYWLDNNIKKI